MSSNREVGMLCGDYLAKLYATGLTREEIRKARLQPIERIEHGIEEGLKEYGKGACLAVVPEGPYALIKLRKGDKSV